MNIAIRRTRRATHSLLPLREPPVLVLLVDKNLATRKNDANQLLDEGYEVIETESASEAKGILDNRVDVDAMIVDIDPEHTPGGLALVRYAAGHHLTVKILIDSDWSEAGLEADALAADFLPKPRSAHALVRKMRRLLI